jgi:poly(glycerol-phosphate) alpha-glucosyltransferase
MLDEWAVKNSRWKKRLAGLLYENSHLQLASCLRALCQSEARAIRSYGLRNPVCVIPNGIDLPESTPSSPPPWAGMIEPGRKVLLYLGRLHPKKGLPNLLRAWADLRQRQSPAADQWDLAIAGWDQGNHENDLKALATQSGIASSVHFLGPQFGEAKASAYHHADAFVLPSFSEGLPMVVLEAWANRVPVVMTPECNLPEGFEADAAIRVTTEPREIAAGLEALFAMPDGERRAMGARGHQLVAEKFTWPQIAAQLIGVTEWVLGGGDQPECVLNA